MRCTCVCHSCIELTLTKNKCGQVSIMKSLELSVLSSSLQYMSDIWFWVAYGTMIEFHTIIHTFSRLMRKQPCMSNSVHPSVCTVKHPGEVTIRKRLWRGHWSCSRPCGYYRTWCIYTQQLQWTHFFQLLWHLTYIMACIICKTHLVCPQAGPWRGV